MTEPKIEYRDTWPMTPTTLAGRRLLADYLNRAIERGATTDAGWLVTGILAIEAEASTPQETQPLRDALERLRALSDAATSGPWTLCPDLLGCGCGHGTQSIDARDGGVVIAEFRDLTDPPNGSESNNTEPVETRRANAALIVEAVKYVRAALRATPEPPREPGRTLRFDMDQDDSDEPCAATESADAEHWRRAETFGHVCMDRMGHNDPHACKCGYLWPRLALADPVPEDGKS